MDVFFPVMGYKSVSRSVTWDFFTLIFPFSFSTVHLSVCGEDRKRSGISLFFWVDDHLKRFFLNNNHHSSLLSLFSFISFLSPRCPNPTYAGCLSACQNSPYVYLCKSHHASPHSASVWVFNCLLQDVAVTCRRHAGGDLCEVKWVFSEPPSRPTTFICQQPSLLIPNNLPRWWRRTGRREVLGQRKDRGSI